MNGRDKFGINEFLKDYPGMSRGPFSISETVLIGYFSFTAKLKNGDPITDSFELKIIIPKSFPKVLPKVIELGKKIPPSKKHKFHVNPDNTFCLGSPLRLLQLLSRKPTLNGFAEKCLVPYLYAVSYKLKYGGDFKLGELQHGGIGAIADYLDLFRLKDHKQIVNTIGLLAKKKRVANKKPCPCNCGLRLGKCKFHIKLNKFRQIAHRSWFKAHSKELGIVI